MRRYLSSPDSLCTRQFYHGCDWPKRGMPGKRRKRRETGYLCPVSFRPGVKQAAILFAVRISEVFEKLKADLWGHCEFLFT